MSSVSINEKCPEVNIGYTKAMFTGIKPIEEEIPWHHSYVMKRCRDVIEEETLGKKMSSKLCRV